jgi:hypothetical protein
VNASTRPLRLLAAMLVAVGALAHPLQIPAARAAAPEVPIVTATTITIVPEQNRVRYTVDATLYQHIADTPTTIYYVNEAHLGVLHGAMNLHASTPNGQALSASVSERHEGYDVVRVRLGTNVYHNQSYRFRLQYDLLAIGPDAADLTQADESFASLVVIAHGTPDTGGQTVTVVLPAGFELGSTHGDIPQPTVNASGASVYSFGEVGVDFFAVMTAQNFSKLNKVNLTATVGDNDVEVLLRGWTDDQTWAAEVGPLFEDGLPLLSDTIGLPYDTEGSLIVDEVVSWVLGGYAGIFDPRTRIIQVANDADPFVILHEAAHAWFNGALVSERWAGEAFASWYALQVAPTLDVPTTGYAPEDPGTVQFVLENWPALGDATEDEEVYGYAASVYVASLLAARAGTDLAEVWQAVATGEDAYQPQHASAPERSAAAATDDRHLLDLLEERTGAEFDDIFSTWVFASEVSGELPAREDARTQYSAVVDHAGAWELPVEVRNDLEHWQFAAAGESLTAAEGVLDEWDDVSAAAGDLDLTPPDDIQTDFEAGAWEAASGEAEAELDTLDHLAAASEALAEEPGFVETIGMVGADPAADLATAETAYESGDLESATTSADAVLATREQANDAGTLRLGAVGGGALLLVIGGGSLWLVLRRRRPDAEPVTEAVPDDPEVRG